MKIYKTIIGIIALVDESDAAFAHGTAQCCQENVGNQAAGENGIGSAPLQHGLHQPSGVGIVFHY